MILDGSKTGLKVKSDVVKKDTANFDRALKWKSLAPNDRGKQNARRSKGLGSFVMDFLSDQAKARGDNTIISCQNRFGDTTRHVKDQDLIQPWLDAQNLAERSFREDKSDRMIRDLDKIKAHVEQMYHEHREEIRLLRAPASPTKGSPSKGGAAFSDLPIEDRQDTFRALSKKFVSLPLPSEVILSEDSIPMLRASYAYVYDCEQKAITKGWTRE